MRALFAFALLAVLLLWDLEEITGDPASVHREKIIRMDEMFHKCCFSLRIAKPFSNCQSCEVIMEPEETDDEARTVISSSCQKSHTGCYYQHK